MKSIEGTQYGTITSMCTGLASDLACPHIAVSGSCSLNRHVPFTEVFTLGDDSLADFLLGGMTLGELDAVLDIGGTDSEQVGIAGVVVASEILCFCRNRGSKWKHGRVTAPKGANGPFRPVKFLRFTVADGVIVD